MKTCGDFETNHSNSRSTFNYPDRDRSQNGTKVIPPYFFGVYDKWLDIQDNPFETDGWLDHCEAMVKLWGLGSERKYLSWKIRNLIRLVLYGADIPKHLRIPLRLINDTIKREGRIRVLDVGGGFGDNYHLLARCLNLSPGQLVYHVVDNVRLCELGRRILGNGNKDLEFFQNVPDQSYDLVLVIGTLQLIPDWRDFCRTIVSYTKENLYISRSPLRMEGHNFITIQSICPLFGSSSSKKIGEANVTIISINELMEVMYNYGCRLIIKKHHSSFSKKLSRLPSLYRNVSYIDILYKKIH